MTFHRENYFQSTTGLIYSLTVVVVVDVDDVPSRNTLKEAVTVSFHIRSNSVFAYYCILYAKYLGRGLHHNERNRKWKGPKGHKTPYSPSVPFHPRTAVGWTKPVYL
jgi:hypothetical protein